MISELKALFDYYEKEKGIDRVKMVEALSQALLAASKRSIGPARELRIDIDPEKGTIKAWAKLVAVEKVTNPFEEIAIGTAKRLKKDAELGDEIELEVTPKNMGRIAAQTAKQTMLQRLRMAEKENLYDEFKDRTGDVVSGVVRRFDKNDVIVDLGKFEGVMTAKERVATEDYNAGDRMRFYVKAVEKDSSRGPEIILSRAHPNFVRRLFEFEVSEIADRTVEIASIAREAGYRTKVAVNSSDDKVDPVGACVGLRGAAAGARRQASHLLAARRQEGPRARLRRGRRAGHGHHDARAKVAHGDAGGCVCDAAGRLRYARGDHGDPHPAAARCGAEAVRVFEPRRVLRRPHPSL
jgi:N utilization substance protein A